MFLDISNNNGTKYIRVCESVRIQDKNTNKSVPKKKTVINIGPVTRFDDGKPDFIARLKASYAAGNPILEELKPYVNVSVPQAVYNIRLCEGTDECIAHPKLIANLLLEKLLEDLNVAQLIRSYKNHYNVGFDVFGFFKLLLFGRILKPASKWATLKQNNDYAIPLLKGKIQDFNIYKTLDFIYDHRRAIFNRINTSMVKHYRRTTNKIYYDVTNFFFEIEDNDEDVTLQDGNVLQGIRKKGVSKEHRETPIVQMGLLMDEYSEKVLTYWSKKYYDKEVAERSSFYEFVQEYLKDPVAFRINSSRMPLIKKYLKKNVVNKKTGEILNSSDLAAILDIDALKMDYDLMGYYTLATSEIHMNDQQMIDTYGNLVEIEDQFRVMKGTLDTRPIFVRTKEHIIAHLTICTIALILLRLIQRQLKEKYPDAVDSDLIFSRVLSADRIQAALNKWKIEALGDTYYRFCDTDDPDLSLILSAFNASIPPKCYKISEVKQLKSKMELSM